MATKHGCYDHCTPSTCMALPPGTTCGACAHFDRCEALYGHTATDTYCDWFPRKFSPMELTAELFAHAARTGQSPKDEDPLKLSPSLLPPSLKTQALRMFVSSIRATTLAQFVAILCADSDGLLTTVAAMQRAAEVMLESDDCSFAEHYAEALATDGVFTDEERARASLRPWTERNALLPP